MTEHNLPDKDNAPWLDCIDGFQVEGPNEYNRTARFVKLKEHDYFAAEEDFMEVTEWYNGEGFDMHITSKTGIQQTSMTWGEYKALRAVIGDWYDDDDDESDD